MKECSVGTVEIEGRTVGPGHPCFFIAEAGSNHNGDLNIARRQIEIAARAGADAIKFQVFRANRMYPRNAGKSDYLRSSTPIYNIIESMEMPYEWLPDLAGYCKEHSIIFLASVFDEESADELDPYVSAFKIASYEMTHVPLIEHVCRKHKPVIMSTGTATLEEVAESVEVFRNTGNTQLVILQCTGSYPTPLKSLNIRSMMTFLDRFEVPVGLSDHSRDPVVAPVSAVACGASVIEKHFTLSNELPGPDHPFALEPAELSLMIEKVREGEQALGQTQKPLESVEHELRAFCRRSIFAVEDIKQGETFTPRNIAVLRCGQNNLVLHPREYHAVLGNTSKRFIASDTSIRQDDFS